MKEDAAPEPIISPEGRRLGTFLAGLGYWITPENQHVARKVIEDGRAIEAYEEDAPLNKAGIELGRGEGKVRGSVSLEKLKELMEKK